MVMSGTRQCAGRQGIWIPPVCAWYPSPGCFQSSPQSALSHKGAVGTAQTVSGGAGKRSPNHLCPPQEKSSFLLIELPIPLAISKSVFEALTL